MDRYLSHAALHSRAQLQLLGATAVFVAAKTTGIENTFIGVDDIVTILGGAYDTQCIKVCGAEV